MKITRVPALLVLLCVVGSAGTSTYTVRAGDTLSGIAARFRVPLAALTSANVEVIPDPDRVRAGQKITVPDAKAAQFAAARPISTATGRANNDDNVYVLARGDTLSGIAKRFGTTVPDLIARNELSGTKAILREGQSLKLPPTAQVPVPEAPVCPVRSATKWDFSNSFGSPRDGQRSHAGSDIFAARGTPVTAVVDGRIRAVRGGRAGIGYYLDGVDGVTYYGAHMNEMRTADGASVRRGEVLGTVGNTGNAAGTPPHLHFEIKPGGGGSIDPYSLLRSWCS
jgi:murein DD-endopeptidase MepM/ murein hydrolase activator NlpD